MASLNAEEKTIDCGLTQMSSEYRGDVTSVNFKEHDWISDYVGANESTYMSNHHPVLEWDACNV